MHTKGVFFIVGTGRSGTTLLQAMFMAAPGIFIPPETHFLPLADLVARRHGPPETNRGFEHLLQAVLDMCARQEMPIDAVILEREMREAPRTRADLFDALLWHIRTRRPDCTRLGEKSPVHLPYSPWLLEAFPDCTIINVIRDGRDVAMSHEQALGRNALRAALRWRHDQRLHARFSRELPPRRYTSVRYEDLVIDPKRQMQRLCAFIGEPFCEAMLRPHERAEEGFATWETHKALTRRPITTSRVGRYRTGWSPDKIALFQLISGAELVANGYALEKAPTLRGLWLGLRQVPSVLWVRLRGRVGEIEDLHRASPART
jgi:hypothetical protein